MELMIKRLGELGKVYREGKPSRIANISRACIAGGTALLYTRGRSSRLASVGAGVLLCAGALATRWSAFAAGFSSVSDPKYVMGPQRAAIDRRERPGASRREPRVGRADPRVGSPATARSEIEA